MADCKYCGAKDVQTFFDPNYAKNISSQTPVKTIGAERACTKCGAYVNPVNQSLEGLNVQGKKVVKHG